MCQQASNVTTKSRKIMQEKEPHSFLNRSKMFEMKKKEHLEQIKQETNPDFTPKIHSKNTKSKYLEMQKYGISTDRNPDKDLAKTKDKNSNGNSNGL
eukprot:CAMPEP_0116919424 /NCGR_PEP_ID=MMETSP0467-20121206/20377_1 /TAXON_ID=283647 /ORGANISM="Mesodinium pulex, Strain SPMC105" /LENGTH=96 /DNA_ID=CAMNT_0004596999 /DNA_START=729 /DNA_END=1019 /DNA_ORIENTATION=+